MVGLLRAAPKANLNFIARKLERSNEVPPFQMPTIEALQMTNVTIENNSGGQD